MKFLFVHQNMPGQYREMVRWLVAQGGHEIVFLTQRRNARLAGVTTRVYTPRFEPGKNTFRLARFWEEGAIAGHAAAEAAKALRQDGFTPDIIIGHVGWGELSFLKDVWADVPIIGFYEYYYRITGGIVNFDPAETVNETAPYFARSRNAISCMNLPHIDLGHSPTYWQRDRFPEVFHDRIYVCHDGIRTDLLRPDPDVSVTLERLGRPLTREDEVVTYVARNLEKVRGFHVVMRALPRLLAERPRARVIVIGGNETSYGRKSDHPEGLKGAMVEELGDSVDWDRVHFLGRVPYGDFCKVIQLGRCHLYMSMPFVLSWSLLEAMAMEATVIGSDTAPTREVITHGETGLLADYFDPDALARQVIDVLANPDDYAHLGPAARAQTVERYDFGTVCMPEHARRINSLVPRAKALEVPG